MTVRTVAALPALVAQLPEHERARFARLFWIDASEARLVLPPGMTDWVESIFGSLEAVERQRVMRVVNTVTGEETLFNTLRATRPLEVYDGGYDDDDLSHLLESGRGDPFCHPLDQTPEDVFGRVIGRHSVTASNIAKADGFHGVVIFAEHNPLRFDRDAIADYLRTGLAWGERVLTVDPTARYWVFWWNALWKSGASILHGHAQVLASRCRHYGRIDHLLAAAAAYRARHGAHTSYFEDLVATHRALGLSLHHGSATLLASLTPVKEREVWILDFHGLTESLLDLVHRALTIYTRGLGVQSFNLAYLRPPLGEPLPAPLAEAWRGFPHIVRILDRGSLATPMADIGGLELYAGSSVANDPFELLAQLHAAH